MPGDVASVWGSSNQTGKEIMKTLGKRAWKSDQRNERRESHGENKLLGGGFRAPFSFLKVQLSLIRFPLGKKKYFCSDK